MQKILLAIILIGTATFTHDPAFATFWGEEQKAKGDSFLITEIQRMASFDEPTSLLPRALERKSNHKPADIASDHKQSLPAADKVPSVKDPFHSFRPTDAAPAGTLVVEANLEESSSETSESDDRSLLDLALSPQDSKPIEGGIGGAGAMLLLIVMATMLLWVITMI